jgi:hypothetical protein
MSEAKIEIKVGSMSFNAEGTQAWLALQLDKVLAKIPEITITPDGGTGDAGEESPTGAASAAPKKHAGKVTATLAAFIKEKKATGKQARKFLATAMWLHDAKGMNRIATADVSKALSEHNQGKLSNASQCLINQTKTGYFVKEGRQFYVTDEGRAELNK